MGNRNRDGGEIPPGFRFYPTDEELVVHFLHRKASLLPCHPDVIPDLDIYPYDPWDLNGKAMAEGEKWYFYSRRTQSRITGNGYWKAQGVDEPIFSTCTGGGEMIGMKKMYVFHLGEPPQGAKTNWLMQEYRLSPENNVSTSKLSKKRHSKKQEHRHSKWVVCRVYEQNLNGVEEDDGTELSCLDEIFLSLDDLDDISQT